VNGLTIEHHILNGGTGLSSDIAQHLCTRLLPGRVAVVSKQPTALLASTRKQWLKILRHVQAERAGTLDSQRIAELTHTIARMRSLEFSAQPPLQAVRANVSFATIEQFIDVPPMCHTLYVATPTDKDTLPELTRFMPKHSLVVIYGVERP